MTLTFTLQWYAAPIIVILAGIVIAFIIDADFRENRGGMLSGCLGMMVIGIALFVACGIIIGHYL